jgi:methyl-accepting chemotaxis protein
MSALESGTESIQRRIGRTFLATTGLALFLTAGALSVTAFLQFRSVTDESLLALAGLIGRNVEASLLFADERAAMETLRALEGEPSIESGIVYDSDGRVFAKFLRSDVADFEPTLPDSEAPRWSWERIELASPIRMGDELIGTVYLRSDTREAMSLLGMSVAIVGSVVLISLFLCWYGAVRLRRHIATPLERLVEGSAAMAEGDLDTSVDVRSNDELGVLARAFNAMVESLRGLVARVGENTRYVAQATERLAHSSTSMREEAARQSAAVESTAESVERITSSMHNVNASVEALSDTAVETSSAAMEMNTSIAATSGHIDELSQIIDTTASSVVQMTTAIREIAQSADVLNQSTESTASSLQLLTGSVRQVESTARESHQLSDEASKKAEKGIAAVTETVEGMKEIQASFKGIETIITDLSQKSESIDAVVKVIESVVEQTNLLALNAAIISSQAGEHGRAFSVVAEEVRSLADRTAASTREIAELIESVQSGVHDAVAAMSQGATRVDHGVELSNEAGRILREIGESSEQSTRWAKEIVEATGGQTSDIDQVGLAMNQVKDIATQLNRATHEQDSAGSEITRGVEKMLQLGREVKNATQEQTRESNLITRSVEVVAARIKEILSETQDQSKRADQIQEALQVFREVTEQSTRSAAHTGEIVSDLLAHSQGLEEEIGRFRL